MNKVLDYLEKQWLYHTAGLPLSNQLKDIFIDFLFLFKRK